jgi:phosphoserine aminotransferase
MKKYNFGAGPSILPACVMEATAAACLDFNGMGLSLMEISHRTKEFQAVMDEAQALFKELLAIPEGYSVVFLGGGASLEFAMVPMNFLEKKAAYLNTGVWAKKAIKEAKAFGEVAIVASSEADNFTYVPKDFEIPADADYLHITTNNTIYGTELRTDLDSPIPVIADMSSDIFSRPIDVSKYGMIYGGAQKNLSMSGVTFVIVKDELLGKVSRHIPTMLDYRTHVSKGSMFNTPPVVPIYCAMQTLRWIKSEGGVAEMARRAEERAALLYAEIDRNKLFRGTAQQDSRSLMNICFVMNDAYKELEQEFLQFAQQRGIVGIKGHRDVGGFRASCYNAMPLEGVKELVKVMQEFEATH